MTPVTTRPHWSVLFQLSCCSSDSEMLPPCSVDWTSFMTAGQMKPRKLSLFSAPCQSKSTITFPHPEAVLVKTRFSLHHNRLYWQGNLPLSLSSPAVRQVPFHFHAFHTSIFIFFSSHSCLILAPSLSFFFLIHAPLQALVSRYSWLGWSADASLESFGI